MAMIKGETLKLCVTVSDASAVEFRFGGGETHTAPATQSGSDWSILVDTSAWTAGIYRWQAWVIFTDGSKRVVRSENFELSDDLAVGDVRSIAAKMVEMIQAMMAGNASEGVKSYKINNRELERYSVDELLTLLRYWRSRLSEELRKGKGKHGLGPRIEVTI